ncbi:putative ATPase [Burkholderiales bacterium JOSHI_001]|nr:putative ATPase [Burkholderiales bacterium JOSHI_001]
MLSSASALPAAPPLPDSAPRWRLRLLGGFELQRGAQRLDRLPSRAAEALLARLAMAPQRAHAREALIELLWPGVALDVGRNRLRQVLSTLKTVLEPRGDTTAAPAVLQANRLTLALLPQAIDCDVPRFEALVRQRHWVEAQSLYQGELLPGLMDEWIEDERRRLAALAERVAEQAVQQEAATGANAAPPTPWPAADGVAPLPNFLGRFIGADDHAARLQGLLQGHRLVTVLGPGGAGKTRLVVELAHALRQSAGTFSSALTGAAIGWEFDAVMFVSLVDCTDMPQADAALATALQPQGGGTGPKALRQLEAVLAGRRGLLLLDNLEPLGAAAGPWVQQLLGALPGLHVLATSRRALGVAGEQEFALPALRLPPPDADADSAAASPALALLLDRARAVRADVTLGPLNLGVMVALAHALEGWPLAIELAASRLRSMPPADLLQGLQGPGTAALTLLARPGAAHRHDSIERSIAASWQPLSAAARDLLCGLTVWRGPFSLQAARQLSPRPAHESWAALDELVAHSMLRLLGGHDETRRVALFQPVREFASAQMDAPAQRAWRARLRHWAVQWARALPPTPALASLREELPHLQAALESAAADAPQDPAAAEAAIELLTAWRRPADDVPLPTAALAQAEAAVAAAADPRRRGLGLSLLGPMWFRAGQAERALQAAQAGLAAEPQPGTARAGALHRLARVLWRSRHRVDEVQPLLAEARALEAAHPSPELRASLLALQAFVTNQGLRDPARGEALHAQALALWQALDRGHAVNDGLYNLAVCAANARRWQQALERAGPVADSARALGHARLLSQALNLLGNVHSGLRQWPQARERYLECIQVAWQQQLGFDLAYGLWNLPRALAHLKRPDDALQLAAFAALYWQRHFGELNPADQRQLLRLRRLAGAAWALEGDCDAKALQARADAQWQRGQSLTLAQAVTLALG